jgi:hypothetical protein
MFVLAATIAALYRFHLSGAWRWVYVVCAVAALHFNSLVLVVQAFLKIPELKIARSLRTRRFGVTGGALALRQKLSVCASAAWTQTRWEMLAALTGGHSTVSALAVKARVGGPPRRGRLPAAVGSPFCSIAYATHQIWF